MIAAADEHPTERAFSQQKFSNGLVAHECILDLRAFKSVTAEDVAKRLMGSPRFTKSD